MSIRTVTTRSSIWTFDDQAKTYTRVPRVQGADHPNVAYQAEPIRYLAVSDFVDQFGARLHVTHPDGSWIVTGVIETAAEAAA
jgi:hypothetical protein